MSSVSHLGPNRCLVTTDTFGSAVIDTHTIPPPLKISVMWFALEQSLPSLYPASTLPLAHSSQLYWYSIWFPNVTAQFSFWIQIDVWIFCGLLQLVFISHVVSANLICREGHVEIVNKRTTSLSVASHYLCSRNRDPGRQIQMQAHVFIQSPGALHS